MSELEWEDVDETPLVAGFMRRAKVPGGWIYERTNDLPIQREGQTDFGLAWSSSLCFVPDLNNGGMGDE